MNNPISQIESKVIQSLDSGVIVIDPTGVVLIINPSAIKHLKVSPTLLVKGTNLFELEQLSFFRDIYDELINAEVISRREITVEDNNETFTIGLTATLLREEGYVQGAVFLFTDLTEIKRLQHETELNRQLAQIGELTAGIVHEFRNPLGVISGMAELVLEKVSDKPDLAQKIQIIINETNYLNLLVSQFLSFAKPQEVNIQKNLVDYILQRALLLCNHLISKYDVKVKVEEIPKELHFVYADSEKVAQALANIIRNGIEVQSNEENKEIKISIRKMNEYIVFRIEDNGPGLPKKLKKNELFKPFVSLKKGGTGLGLSIVHRIVTIHNGFVNCGDKSPKGAFFEIAIPQNPSEKSYHSDIYPNIE
ncbi:MAG: ATP-binding protein [Candidatus Hydrogenedentes bacterium]|nr:ATP-binding protein [Candidatus Hydrogenedentota bacterium]